MADHYNVSRYEGAPFRTGMTPPQYITLEDAKLAAIKHSEEDGQIYLVEDYYDFGYGGPLGIAFDGYWFVMEDTPATAPGGDESEGG